MKLHDRVYREDPTKLGIVTATSADGDADVFEGETVEVRWDGSSKTEVVAVEQLDRLNSIYHLPGTHANSSETYAQLGSRNRMVVRARDFVHDDPNGVLMFRVGPESAKRKVIVKLLPSDTYAVEVGHIDRETYGYVPDAQETDVYCDVLGETVVRLYGR